MNSLDKDIALTQQRMDQMDKKLDKVEEKIDNLTKTLLDPDNGLVTKVNENTNIRRALVKAVWVLYSLIAGALIKIIFDNLEKL